MESRRPLRLKPLSPRQFEVVRLRAQGYTIAEVGAQLGIAEQTVDNHLELAYRHYRVSNLVGLLWQLGWIRIPDVR